LICPYFFVEFFRVLSLQFFFLSSAFCQHVMFKT
jgi:hypothetical protein